MPTATIDRLIVNSPYEEPQCYWTYDRETRLFDLIEGERRPAGYIRASASSKTRASSWTCRSSTASGLG